jgi:ArsR family transcriptional regulator, arsenate/arsenite/antimonite-responsive transcriptional repressor
MSVDLELTPKTKRAAGERCCEPVVYPDVERDQAVRMAAVAKALGDPVRLQLVDVLRKHAGKVCVCELVPLFDLSQPTVSHHLKVLRDAGVVGSERQGLWAYYFVIPDALEGLSGWLSESSFQLADTAYTGGSRAVTSNHVAPASPEPNTSPVVEPK